MVANERGLAVANVAVKGLHTDKETVTDEAGYWEIPGLNFAQS
jgi:hypothetical protein